MGHQSVLFNQDDNEQSELYETNRQLGITLSVQDRMKLIEDSIMRKVGLSSLAAEAGEFERAFKLAKEALESLNSLRAIVLQEQRANNASISTQTANEDDDSLAHTRDVKRMTTGVNLFDILIMVKSNLAAQLKNNGQLDESLELYTQICKLATASTSGTGSSAHASMSNGQQQQHSSRYFLYRFGLNIGNVLYDMGEYQRALKYYRLTLDRLSSSGNRSMRIKHMNNISIALMAMNGVDSGSGYGARKQTSLIAADHVTSLNRLLADNLNEQQQQIQQQPSRQARLNSTNTASGGGGGAIFQASNSNHHRFGLNLMACYHGDSDLRSMRATLSSLITVDICHHYERVFDFDKLLNDDSFSVPFNANESGQQPDSADRRESAHARPGQRSASDGHEQSVVNQSDKAANVNAEQQSVLTMGDSGYASGAPSMIVSESDKVELSKRAHSTVERFRQVMVAIREDKLEMLISEKEKEISRSIIVACNLTIDLGRQKKRVGYNHQDQTQADRDNIGDDHDHSKMKKVRRPQSNSALKTSAFDQCIQLLATSDLYKSLVYDLRVNNVSKLLMRKGKLRTALRRLERIHSEQHVGAAGGGGQMHNRPPDSGSVKSARIESNSTMVATDLGLLCLLKNQIQLALNMNKRALKISKFNVESLVNMANCHFKSKDLTNAEIFYVQALKIDPNNWIANYNLAVLNSKLGRHLDDLNPTTKKFIISNMHKLTPPACRKLSLSQYLLAHLYQQSGLNTKSNALFTQLANGNGSSPEVYVHASKSLGESSNSGRAISPTSFLQHAQQIHSYYLPIAEHLIALHISQFKYDEAEVALMDCIKNRPDQARWYQMLAECYRRAADYKKAIKVYKYAIDKFPMDTSCVKALAKLADELGLVEEREACCTKLQLISERVQAQQVGGA